LTNSSYSL